MGEIAEMMLDGTLCEGCGEYMGDEVGFPRLCAGCAKDRRAAGHEVERNGLGGFVDCGNGRRGIFANVSCPICKRRVKWNGLPDHQRTVHGVRKT